MQAAAFYRLRWQPLGAAVLVVVRSLTLLLALQFSGALHDVADVVEAVVSAATPNHEQCPPDRPCEDCPPGCPNCHCATPTSVAAVPPQELSPPPALASLPARLYATQALPGPERPSLFRPPRA